MLKLHNMFFGGSLNAIDSWLNTFFRAQEKSWAKALIKQRETLESA